MTLRWLLHPITAAGLLMLAATAGFAASPVLLLVVAGAAAGFANSGST